MVTPSLAALVYYDELNIANGWYLTGWCPQFEKGAVLVPIEGQALLLGGLESEPFAKMSAAIKETRCFPVFMVPDEEYPNATIINFQQLNDELKAAAKLCDEAFDTMKAAVKPEAREFEVAAAGEYVCRKNGASSFAYSCIVGSGERAQAVVPTAINKVLDRRPDMAYYPIGGYSM